MFSKLFTIVAVFFFSGNYFCQKIDSVKKIISPSRHDTLNGASYMAIGDMYYLINVDSAVYYWTKAKDFCEAKLKTNTNKLITLSLKRGLANAYNNIGLIKSNKGDVKGALDDYLVGLKLYEEVNDKIGLLSILNNQGIIYYTQNEFQKAEENFNRAIKIAIAIDDKIGLTNSYSYLGYMAREKRDVKKTLEYFFNALEMAKSTGDQYQLAYINNDIGVMYCESNTDKALEYFENARKIRETIGEKQGLSNSYNNIGDLYLGRKEYNKAEENLKKALALAKEMGYPDNIRRPAEHLKNVYKALGQHEKALEMFELSALMNDSINNRENRKATIRSQLKYEIGKKAVADSIKASDEKLLISSKLKEEKTKSYALYGGLSLVILFSLFMVNRFKVTNRQKKIIELKEKETQKQNEIIIEQKKEVEVKQKEVLDSIQYAKRIQLALMPTEKFVAKTLSRLKKK